MAKIGCILHDIFHLSPVSQTVSKANKKNAILAQQQKPKRSVPVKKIFSQKMAFVYGRLLILSLACFGIAVTAVIGLNFFSLPVDAMPISSVPRFLFLASMVFGALTVMSYWKVNIPTLISLCVTGILLTIVFNFFSKGFLDAIGYGQEKTVVVESKRKRDYNLGYGVVVVESICVSNGYLIDVYDVTKIYERYGPSFWQKRRVGLDALQSGQVVDITLSSFGDDNEFYDLLRDKFPPYGLDYTVWAGAAEITIRKGEYSPVDSQTGDSLCEILFQE